MNSKSTENKQIAVAKEKKQFTLNEDTSHFTKLVFNQFDNN